MFRRFSPMLVLLTTLALAGACRGTSNVPAPEQPAPPDRLMVTTGAGQRLTGAVARLDLRYSRGADRPPDIELSLTATDASGNQWGAQAVAAPALLAALAGTAPAQLTVKVLDGPLAAGTGSVQIAAGTREAQFAPAGSLAVTMQAGRLRGDASGMEPTFAARFEGPFAVTCAAPRSTAGNGPATPASAGSDGPPVLLVDEGLTHEPCRQHARWAGGAP